MKIVLWGAGSTGLNCWKKIADKDYIYNDIYLAFSDNNQNIWGQQIIDGKAVLSPEEVLKTDFDKIVITSIYGKSISNELHDKLGISLEKIQLWEDYSCEKTAQAAYRQNYPNKLCSPGKEIFNKDKVVIYTAIMGDYDELKVPEFLSSHIDYICFTNNRNLKSDIWQVNFVEDHSISNQLFARKIKLNPHLYLKEYDTSIWIDGKFKIQSDLRNYIKKYEKAKPILCFPHYERECIYEEEAICMLANNADKEMLLKQIMKYYSEGYPLKNGLYETGCIVRKHNEPEVIKIMEEWEKEIINFSIRDQISFPYICWKNNFTPDISDIYINKNRWIEFFPHK